MYTYKRFRTSKAAVTIILIALALAVWGAVEFTGNALAKKPDGGGGGGGKEEVTYTVTYTQIAAPDLFDLEGSMVTLSDDARVFNLRTQVADLSSLGVDWVDHEGVGWWQLGRSKKEPQIAILRYWFTDTTTGSDYLLTMPGTISGEWLSATEPTVVESSGDWVVSTNGGRDKGNGVGEDSGSDLGWAVTLTSE